MKPIVLLIACLALPVASPTVAQDTSEDQEGWDLLREGGRLLLEEFFDEVEPMLEELGPLLEDLQDLAVDLNAYEAPVILPNGDILIRRKPDQPFTPEETPPENEQGDAIDL